MECAVCVPTQAHRVPCEANCMGQSLPKPRYISTYHDLAWACVKCHAQVVRTKLVLSERPIVRVHRTKTKGHYVRHTIEPNHSAASASLRSLLNK